jgi:hypothetical protein
MCCGLLRPAPAAAHTRHRCACRVKARRRLARPRSIPTPLRPTASSHGEGLWGACVGDGVHGWVGVHGVHGVCVCVGGGGGRACVSEAGRWRNACLLRAALCPDATPPPRLQHTARRAWRGCGRGWAPTLRATPSSMQQSWPATTRSRCVYVFCVCLCVCCAPCPGCRGACLRRVAQLSHHPACLSFVCASGSYQHVLPYAW